MYAVYKTYGSSANVYWKTGAKMFLKALFLIETNKKTGYNPNHMLFNWKMFKYIVAYQLIGTMQSMKINEWQSHRSTCMNHKNMLDIQHVYKFQTSKIQNILNTYVIKPTKTMKFISRKFSLFGW